MNLKSLWYELALFLALNTAHAQVPSSHSDTVKTKQPPFPILSIDTTKNDTAKNYSLDAIVVEANAINEMKKSFSAAMAANDPAKALTSVAGVNTDMPYLSARFSLNGLDFEQLGTFDVYGIGLTGNSTQLFGGVSLFNPHVVNDIEILKTNYSLAYDGLAGVARVKFKKYNSKRVDVKISTGPIDRIATVSVPFSFGSNVLSYRNITPWKFIEKWISQLSYLPTIHEFTDHASLFDDDLNIVYRRSIEQKNFNDPILEGVDEHATNDLLAIHHVLHLDSYSISSKFGYEYYGLNLHSSGYDWYAYNPVGIGIANYTLGVELKKNDGKFIFGVERTSLSSKGLDEEKLNRISADEAFAQAMRFADFPDSTRNRLTTEYQKVPQNQRYVLLRSMVQEAIAYRQIHSTISSDEYRELLFLQDKLSRPERQPGDYNNIKDIEALKMWSETNVILNEFLLQGGLGLVRPAMNHEHWSAEGNIGLQYQHGQSIISANYAHRVNYRVKNGGALGNLFLQNVQINDNSAEHYALSFDQQWKQSIIQKLNILFYWKNIHADYQGTYVDDISVHGVDMSASGDTGDESEPGNLSYIANVTFSGSDMFGKSLPGTINNKISADISYRLFDRLKLFSQSEMHDGVYTQTRKLDASYYLSIGGEFSFDIFGKKNMACSLGFYNILNMLGVHNQIGVLNYANNQEVISEPTLIMFNIEGNW
jgi:hypothetical protein